MKIVLALSDPKAQTLIEAHETDPGYKIATEDGDYGILAIDYSSLWKTVTFYCGRFVHQP